MTYSRTVEEIVDKKTGEVIQRDIIEKKLNVKSFYKVYLMDLLTQLKIISNSKQFDVLFYMLEHINPSTNFFIGTYEVLAKGANASVRTVADMMMKLKKNGIIYQTGSCRSPIYMISPKYIIKGNENKREMLIRYEKTAQAEQKDNNIIDYVIDEKEENIL